jgi:enoyl-CoA hydratase
MPTLIYDKHDGIARITLNRPEKRNAMTPEMSCRMADAWADSAADPAVRIILLSATGDTAFCAGSDLTLAVPLKAGRRAPSDEWDERYLSDPTIVERALLKGVECFKPIVAAINGIAIGGGMEMLMGTDIRIAAENARFGLSEVARGLVPAGGSMVHLPRQVGWCAAMELIMLGEPVSAVRAREIGLINQVVPAGELAATAEAVARKLAAGAPIAQQEAKRAMLLAADRSLEEGYACEQLAAAAVRHTEDAQEGIRAFVERRSPVFVGR